MGADIAHCFFCGTAAHAGSACPSCLVPVAAHEPPFAGPGAPPLACPRCAVPLTAIGITRSATLHTCARCRGMFVGGRAWSAIADDPALARTIAAKLPAGGQTPSQLLPLVRCPSCAREMERGRWGASSSVIVDVCIMHGLWLDAGEIASLAEHAALRTRVGAVAARQATNASESRPLDLALLVADAASQARLEAAERRSRVVKRGGVLLLFAFVAARLAFAVLGGGTKSPPREVLKAGEAAASAATALGGR